MELEGQADDKERTCCKCNESIPPKTPFMNMPGDKFCHQTCFSLGDCNGCGKDLLPTQDIMKALGHQYHVGCFTCSLCPTAITGNYVAREGKPICEGCVAAERKAAAEKVRGTCGGCSGPVRAADKAVSFAGSMWHMACFVCNKCKGSLQAGVGEVKGRFYCGGCLKEMRELVEKQEQNPAQLQLQTSAQTGKTTTETATEGKSGAAATKNVEQITCHWCKMPVTSGKIVRMLGHVWHLDCVHCHHCRKKIVGNQMAELDGEPHCIDCAKALFEKKREEHERRQREQISAASVPASPAAQSEGAAVPAAAPAVKCCVCNMSVGSEWQELSGEPYCDACAKLTQSSIQCEGCSKKVESGVKFKKALGKFWHVSCFKCAKCSAGLDPKNYQTHAGELVCDEHYETATGVIAFKCFTCLKRIFGQMVTHDNKSYHPECFVCTKCKEPFPNGEYSRGKSGALYCRPCFLHGADR
mmetsp:Transcript_14498/g.56985  ORF Transcript_14498/g.56985 Transcript_14498/m.56985 type:complete len:470 (-) Transcript_14498:47-1456(-)